MGVWDKQAWNRYKLKSKKKKKVNIANETLIKKHTKFQLMLPVACIPEVPISCIQKLK
jgi:hypothetical protein